MFVQPVVGAVLLVVTCQPFTLDNASVNAIVALSPNVKSTSLILTIGTVLSILLIVKFTAFPAFAPSYNLADIVVFDVTIYVVSVYSCHVPFPTFICFVNVVSGHSIVTVTSWFVHPVVFGVNVILLETSDVLTFTLVPLVTLSYTFPALSLIL